MTFMDVRFLILELDVALKEARVARPVAPVPPAPDEVAEDDELEPEHLPPARPEDGLGGKLAMEIDRVMKPGALLSGTVTFSDGVTAVWLLDQMGRLSISPSQPGYRPSEADNKAFVQALQDEIAKKGM